MNDNLIYKLDIFRCPMCTMKHCSSCPGNACLQDTQAAGEIISRLSSPFRLPSFILKLSNHPLQCQAPAMDAAA